jgi:drug/metabolite transporter (DMT)-like permease
MTAISPDARRSLLAANLICLASMVIWAAGLPAGNLIVPHMPPVALTAARATLAALVLVPVWWAVEGGSALRDADWLRGAWVGFVALGLASVFVVIALALTDSVTVAIVTAVMPVAGIALECLADKRPFTKALALGLLLSLIGGAVALSGNPGSVDIGFGALAALASVLCYTWGSRETVRALPQMTALGRSAVTVAGAAIVMLIAALADGLIRNQWPDWGAIGVLEFSGLAIFGIGSMALSQLMWIVSVGRIGIGAASLHMNAVPFYVMLIVFLFGGPWSWAQALGAVIVVTGALIAQGLIRRPS